MKGVLRFDPLLALSAAALALPGCTSMSGLSGSSSYACKAPEGVTCDSVSGTYANAVQNNLPSQRPRRAAPGSPERSDPPQPSMTAASAPTATVSPPPTPVSLRTSPRILRLWFKPWEDADHDLYDQGYVYVQIDAGQWQIEHVQRLIRDAYAPLRPPPPASARPAGGPTESRDPRTSNQSGRTDQPSGSLSLPGLTPPAGRPQMPVDPRGNEPND